MDALRNQIDNELFTRNQSLIAEDREYILPYRLQQILYSLIDEMERMDKGSINGDMYREHLAMQEKVIGLAREVKELKEEIKTLKFKDQQQVATNEHIYDWIRTLNRKE